MPSNQIPEDVRAAAVEAIKGLDWAVSDVLDILDAIAPLIIEWAQKDQAEIAPLLIEHEPTQWRSFTTDELVLRCCGQDFGPKYTLPQFPVSTGSRHCGKCNQGFVSPAQCRCECHLPTQEVPHD